MKPNDHELSRPFKWFLGFTIEVIIAALMFLLMTWVLDITGITITVIK